MLKDITLGQYYPGKSVVHRIDPRMKIILTIVYVVMLFIVNHPAGLIVGLLVLVVGYGTAKIPPRVMLGSLKPVLPIILFTAVLNIFFIDGTVLYRIWIIKITEEGLLLAAVMAVRILCLIAGTSLLTYTTSPIVLTDGLEQLMAPLKKIKLPVHELAMMMTIALRFIPTLIEETDKIMSAQKARGADMETGGLIKRAKALIPILIPLFVSAFRRADELALAMECRCYRGGEGRTRMKQLRFSAVDAYSLLFFVLCFAVIIVLNLMLPAIV